MPAILTDAPPIRLDLPSIVLDAGVAADTIGLAPIQAQCAARMVADAGDQQFEDVETFCRPGAEAPTIVTGQSLNLTFVWSFGPLGSASLPEDQAGIWNALKQIEGALVEYAFLPVAGATSSETNPEEYGRCYVPYIPLINAGVRRHSIIDLEFRKFGIPAYNTDGNPVFDHPFGDA